MRQKKLQSTRANRKGPDLTPALSELSESQHHAASPTRRVSALMGFVLKAEIDAAFKQTPIQTADGRDPVEVWRELEERRPKLPPLAPGRVKRLDGPGLAERIAAVKARETYKRFYESQADFEFASVSIDALLALQWHADLDYIDELARRLNPAMTPEEQLLFAMSESRIPAPVVMGTQVLFTSLLRDLYAEKVPQVRELAEGEFEITLRAGSRPNYVQVAQFENRFALINGVHKVCALKKAGFIDCMCLLRRAEGKDQVLQAPTSLYRDSVFLGPRPALVIDFLNPDASAILRKRAQYQVLQVSIQVGEITPPALP